MIPKIAEFFEVSAIYLITGEEDKNNTEQEKKNAPSAKFVNKATYNGTVNEVTGDYAHQENYIGIPKSDLPNKATANEIVVELDDLIRSLDNDSMKELLIAQVRTSIETFRQLSESNKKKQN